MAIIVIQNVRLFDGHDVQSNTTVTFDSSAGTIVSVSKSAPNDIPKDAEVIDGSGHTLLPGLIDAHVHVYDLHLPQDGSVDPLSTLRTPLQCGVTTLCDMHCDPGTIYKFRGLIKDDTAKARAGGGSGKVELCDVKSSLYGATIEGGWPKPIVLAHDPTEELKSLVAKWPSLTPQNAKDFITSHKGNGADYIKLMQENCCSLAIPNNSIPVATLELQTAVVKAAHDVNLKVYGHATAWESTEIVLRSGADGLTHTFVDQAPREDIMVPEYKKNNACVIPTLVVLSSLTGELQDLREKFADIARATRPGAVDDFMYGNMKEFLGMRAPQCTIEHAFESVKMFKRNGIDVVAGTDSSGGLKGTGVGPSLWMELELYVDKCGMTPVEALRSATGVSARRFGFTDRGVVEAGRRADLLLCKGDPTQNLGDLWQDGAVVGVWREGLRAV